MEFTCLSKKNILLFDTTSCGLSSSDLSPSLVCIVIASIPQVQSIKRSIINIFDYSDLINSRLSQFAWHAAIQIDWAHCTWYTNSKTSTKVGTAECSWKNTPIGDKFCTPVTLPLSYLTQPLVLLHPSEPPSAVFPAEHHQQHHHLSWWTSPLPCWLFRPSRLGSLAWSAQFSTLLLSCVVRLRYISSYCTHCHPQY